VIVICHKIVVYLIEKGKVLYVVFVATFKNNRKG